MRAANTTLKGVERPLFNQFDRLENPPLHVPGSTATPVHAASMWNALPRWVMGANTPFAKFFRGWLLVRQCGRDPLPYPASLYLYRILESTGGAPGAGPQICAESTSMRPTLLWPYFVGRVLASLVMPWMVGFGSAFDWRAAWGSSAIGSRGRSAGEPAFNRSAGHGESCGPHRNSRAGSETARGDSRCPWKLGSGLQLFETFEVSSPGLCSAFAAPFFVRAACDRVRFLRSGRSGGRLGGLPGADFLLEAPEAEFVEPLEAKMDTSTVVWKASASPCPGPLHSIPVLFLTGKVLLIT